MKTPRITENGVAQYCIDIFSVHNSLELASHQAADTFNEISENYILELQLRSVGQNNIDAVNEAAKRLNLCANARFWFAKHFPDNAESNDVLIDTRTLIIQCFENGLTPDDSSHFSPLVDAIADVVTTNFLVSEACDEWSRNLAALDDVDAEDRAYDAVSTKIRMKVFKLFLTSFYPHARTPTPR